jgi:hypothetical protein
MELFCLISIAQDFVGDLKHVYKFVICQFVLMMPVEQQQQQQL